jgi:hypothetical protein
MRREMRTFMQYLGDSLPWPSLQGSEVQARLSRIIDSERDAISELGRLLGRLRVQVPYVASYPTHFTTANFVSLHHLLPVLLDEERNLISALDRDIRSLHHAEAIAVLRSLVDTKRHSVSELEQMSKLQMSAVAAAK